MFHGLTRWFFRAQRVASIRGNNQIEMRSWKYNDRLII